MLRIPAALRFHLGMAGACAAILSISIVACRYESVHVAWRGLMIALIVAIGAVLPLPAYWHEKHRIDMRDAALMIPWAFVLAVILPLSVDAAARVARPLQDANFVRLDEAIGISVPHIMTWARNHLLGRVVDKSYILLIPLLPVAVLAPALTGRWREAQGFLVGNIAAFAIGLPLFALFPAVGPWYGYHLAATVEQLKCQSDLLLLRIPGPYSFQPAGIVCFPSFHVVWAILCVPALWGFRLLRIPVAILSGMIILSTLTSGWHYFSDVLAGIVVAIVSLVAVSLSRAGAERETFTPLYATSYPLEPVLQTAAAPSPSTQPTGTGADKLP